MKNILQAIQNFEPLDLSKIKQFQRCCKGRVTTAFPGKKKSYGLYDRDLTSIFRVFEVNREERLNMLVEGFQTLGTSDVPT